MRWLLLERDSSMACRTIRFAYRLVPSDERTLPYLHGFFAEHAPWWPLTQERRRLVDQTLPECLRAAGYDTHLIGKWQ